MVCMVLSICFCMVVDRVSVFWVSIFFTSFFWGVCFVYFSSKGSGDLNIKAEVGSLVSEIYTIEDCTKLGWGSGFATTNGSVSINGSSITVNNTTKEKPTYIFNDSIGVPYSVELEYIQTSGSFTYGLGFANSSNNALAGSYFSKSGNNYWGIFYLSGNAPSDGDVFKYVVTSNSVTVYKNNTQIGYREYDFNLLTDGRFAIMGTDTPKKQQWKNFKLKKL